MNKLKLSLSPHVHGGDVDAITASTITSRAFLNAVNNAYKVFKGNVSDANSSATAQN